MNKINRVFLLGASLSMCAGLLVQNGIAVKADTFTKADLISKARKTKIEKGNFNVDAKLPHGNINVHGKFKNKRALLNYHKMQKFIKISLTSKGQAYFTPKMAYVNIGKQNRYVKPNKSLKKYLRADELAQGLNNSWTLKDMSNDSKLVKVKNGYQLATTNNKMTAKAINQQLKLDSQKSLKNAQVTETFNKQGQAIAVGFKGQVQNKIKIKADFKHLNKAIRLNKKQIVKIKKNAQQLKLNEHNQLAMLIAWSKGFLASTTSLF